MESERIPAELVDAFFDRELDEGSREKFFHMLRGDLPKCADVARTQRMISALREPIEAPDLTSRIMGEVSRRRGFLPESLRKMVRIGRLAVAACVLLTLLGVALLHRFAPDSVSLVERPAPVSNVVNNGAQEAATGVQQFTGAVEAVKARIAEPAAEIGRLFSVEDLPEIDGGDQLRARVYLVGGLTPDGAVEAPAALRQQGSLALYGGAGTDAPFMVPSVVYLDGASTRVVLPPAPLLGSRAGWVGAWRENIFLLEPVQQQAEQEP